MVPLYLAAAAALTAPGGGDVFRQVIAVDPAGLADSAGPLELSALAAGAYVVVLLVVAIDAVLPLVPGEAFTIAGGVLAAAGELQLGVLVLAAAAGALAGDCTAYSLGRWAGGAGLGRALKGRRGRQVVRWAARSLERRGGLILLAARFVPGGRTSAAVSAGFVRFPARRYARWSALAGLLWAWWTAGLGYLGGQAFAEQPGIAPLAALAVATAVGLVAMVALPLRESRRSGGGQGAGEHVRGDSCELRGYGDRPGTGELALSKGGDRLPERCS
jgi:membrane-associated protein